MSRLTNKKVLVEGIACSADDARVAQSAGVDRLEICSAMVLGGLTPSLGTFKAIRQATTLDLMAMVRPRASGFCYSSSEFVAMNSDVEALMDAGANGIVFGILDDQGDVDVARCREIISRIGSKQIVFHRAFDAATDAISTLEILVDLGVTRVLTSGQAPSALQGVDLIRRLLEIARDRIEILVGGGVRPETVREIIHFTGARQVHLGPFVQRSDRSIASSEAGSRFFGSTFPLADGDALAQVVRAVAEN
jgi:copper homeostasis protein